MEREQQKVPAICDLVFKRLKSLLSSFNPHSIQTKFPRKICKSITNIDITNIFKVFLLLFSGTSNLHFIKVKKALDVYQKWNLQMILDIKIPKNR